MVKEYYPGIIAQPLDEFPNSFKMLQQEAILCDSCFRTGMDFLLRGGFHSNVKGNYYSAFFQLSIAMERIMKLVFIVEHMNRNGFKAVTPDSLRKLGHDLLTLYDKVREIGKSQKEELIAFPEIDSMAYYLLMFLNGFAHSTGRYYNISNINSQTSVDPIVKWQDYINLIPPNDFGDKDFKKLERTIKKNIIPEFASYDIDNNTGYLKEVCEHWKTVMANGYAVWHIVELVKPVADILDNISMECHALQTSEAYKKKHNNDFPSMPYFNEFFTFTFLEKEDVIKRKRWKE